MADAALGNLAPFLGATFAVAGRASCRQRLNGDVGNGPPERADGCVPGHHAGADANVAPRRVVGSMLMSMILVMAVSMRMGLNLVNVLVLVMLSDV